MNPVFAKFNDVEAYLNTCIKPAEGIPIIYNQNPDKRGKLLGLVYEVRQFVEPIMKTKKEEIRGLTTSEKDSLCQKIENISNLIKKSILAADFSGNENVEFFDSKKSECLEHLTLLLKQVNLSPEELLDELNTKLHELYVELSKLQIVLPTAFETLKQESEVLLAEFASRLNEGELPSDKASLFKANVKKMRNLLEAISLVQIPAQVLSPGEEWIDKLVDRDIYPLFVQEQQKMYKEFKEATIALCQQTMMIPLSQKRIETFIVQSLIGKFVDRHFPQGVENSDRIGIMPQVERTFGTYLGISPKELQKLVLNAYLYRAVLALYLFENTKFLTLQSEHFQVLIDSLMQALPKDFPDLALTFEQIKVVATLAFKQTNERRISILASAQLETDENALQIYVALSERRFVESFQESEGLLSYHNGNRAIYYSNDSELIIYGADREIATRVHGLVLEERRKVRKS